MFRRYSLFLVTPAMKAVIGVFLIIPVTTFYLEPKDFGVAALMSTLLGFVLPLGNLGNNWVLGAYYLQSDSANRKILLFNLVFLEFFLKALMIFGLWLFSNDLLSLVLPEVDESFKYFFNLILIGALASVLWNSLSYVLTLEKRASLFAFLEITGLFVTVFTLFLIVKFSEQKVLALYLPNALSAVGIFIALCFIFYKKLTFKFDFNWIRKSLKVGLPSLPASYSENVVNSMDRLVLGHFSNPSTVGIYSHSRSYQIIMGYIIKAFTQLTNPELINAYHSERSLSKLSNLFNSFFVMLAFAGLILPFVASEFVSFLTHDKFTDAAPLIIGWFVFTITGLYGIPFTQYLISQKKTLLLMTIQIISSSVLLIALYFCVKHFGLIGALFSMLLGNILNQFLRSLFAFRAGCQIAIFKGYSFALICCFIGVFVEQYVKTSIFINFMFLGTFVTLSVWYFYTIFLPNFKNFD